jgi:hypothetical protein
MNNEIKDRGVSRSISGCIEDKKMWQFATFFSLAISMVLAVIIIFYESVTRYYEVDPAGNTNKLVSKGEPYFSETSLMKFADQVVVSSFSLSYAKYSDQLSFARGYYYDDSFDTFVKELQRSNYLGMLEKYHRAVTIVPTSSVYKAEPNGDDIFTIYRSYASEVVGDDGTTRDEVVYAVKIARIKPTERYFSGVMVVGIHQMDMASFKKFDTSQN